MNGPSSVKDLLVDFLFAEAEIKPAQLDVLAAGELRIDAEAPAEQRRGLADDCASGRR